VRALKIEEDPDFLESPAGKALRKNADDGIKDIKIILETTRNKPQ